MLPWSSDFVWDLPHGVFFAAFYLVLAAIGTTIGLALRRTHRALSRGPVIAWPQDFADLPAEARACRHQLRGVAPGRICGNGFDCRTCAEHPAFADRRVPPSARDLASEWDGRLYHRGHTWVEAQADGTLTVGLDILAQRVLRDGDRVELPAPGTELEVNGPLCTIRTQWGPVRVLAPVEGVVLGRTGVGPEFNLTVATLGAQDARHLLSGEEARRFLVREQDRIRRAAAPAEALVMADGGVLVPDRAPAAERDRVLGATFLEP